MLSCYCIAIALMGLMWGYCAWLNRRNAKVREEQAQMEQNELLDEWHDLTDKEVSRVSLSDHHQSASSRCSASLTLGIRAEPSLCLRDLNNLHTQIFVFGFLR